MGPPTVQTSPMRQLSPIQRVHGPTDCTNFSNVTAVPYTESLWDHRLYKLLQDATTVAYLCTNQK